MLKVHRWFILVGIVFIVFIALSVDFRGATFNQKFKSWVKETARIAREQGISENTVLDYLATAEPLEFLLQDKKENLQDKVSALLSDDLILRAQLFYKDNLKILYQKEDEYKVSPEIVVAAMAIGSNLGEALGEYKMIDVLSTLGAKNENGDFYRNELISLFKLIDNNTLTMNVKGHEDGTFTFLGINPSSYLYYGTDSNNDNKVDLFTNNPDVFETYYYLLSQQNWQDLDSWGMLVSLQKGVDFTALEGVSNAKNIGLWKSLGVKKIDGASLNEPDSKQATLIKLNDDQGVLLYDNFNSLFKTNNVLAKSIAIGLLSDKIKDYAYSMEYKRTNVKANISDAEKELDNIDTIKKDDLPPPPKYKDLEFAK